MALDEKAELYLKYDYSDTKELSKHFITVVIAVLVFSLTLAEKIIRFETASYKAKVILFAAWIMMIFAIVACGIGLCFNSLAGGRAANARKDYNAMAQVSYKWLLAAGLCFVLGLISLILSVAAPIFAY